jgi:uncharacterized protein involved in high-affinity Fe2+ transport
MLMFLLCLTLASACSSPTLQAAQAPESTPIPKIQNTPTHATATQEIEINLYLVVLEDEGQTGEPIGCGDSLVAVPIHMEDQVDPLEVAYQYLLSIKDRIVDPYGLYNALYQSDLHLEKTSIDENGLAQVYLSGSYLLGGVCDNPRFEAQLTHTALQFPQVQQVEVFINGEPLEEILSLQG